MSPRTRSKQQRAPADPPAAHNFEPGKRKTTTQKGRGRSRKPRMNKCEQQPNPKASKTPTGVPHPPKGVGQLPTPGGSNESASSCKPQTRVGTSNKSGDTPKSSKRAYKKPSVESADEIEEISPSLERLRQQTTPKGFNIPQSSGKPSNRTGQQPTPKVSETNTDSSKPFKRIAALARLVAAAAQFTKSSYAGHAVPNTTETPTGLSSNDEDIKGTMAQIYSDIDKAWLSGMANNNESSCVSQVIDCAARGLQDANLQHKKPSIPRRLSCFGSKGTSSQITPLQLMLCRRYAAVYARYEMMMLSILAYSNSFRNACRSLDEASWNRLLGTIDQNTVSLELFFKVRDLDWVTPLSRLETYFSPDKVASYIASKRPRELPSELLGRPHSYIVPGDDGALHLTNYQGMLLVDNSSSKYDPQIFHEDPSLRGPYDGSCYSCHRDACDCSPSRCHNVTKPLVELVHCPGKKGVGIRSLQRIRKGDVLNEYIGELKYANSVYDTTYALELEYPPGDEDRMEIDNPILIDAQVYGNWTRYINASCDPSLVFISAVVGKRHRMMVVATRDIEIFEELTIGYGDRFWIESDTQMCECNDPKCRYPDAETKEKTMRGPDAFLDTMDVDDDVAASTVHVDQTDSGEAATTYVESVDKSAADCDEEGVFEEIL